MKIHKNLCSALRSAAVVSIAMSLVVSSSSFTVANADSLSSLKSKYAQLQQQQQQLQQQLNTINREVTTESKKKGVLDKNISVIKQQIKVMHTQIKATKFKLKEKDKDIVKTEKRIKANTALYKERVCTIYEEGNMSKIEVLLSSKSVADFMSRYETLQIISDHDNAIINALKSDDAALKSDEAVLQDDLTSLQASQGALAAKQQILKTQQAQQAQVVATLKHNADAKTQETDAVNEKARETDAQINAEIAKEAAARRRQLEEAQSSSPSSQSGIPSGNGSSVSGTYIVNYAAQFIGVPYVFGSADPSGFDCSGLVQYVYANAAGINLPHSAALQAGYGSDVSRGDLQPGDLVFFATEGGRRITHVGIYAGGDMFIEANSGYSSGHYVMRTALFGSSYWAPKFVCARRLL